MLNYDYQSLTKKAIATMYEYKQIYKMNFNNSY